MLKSIRIRDFRSFIDTETVELGRCNVFIGPNSAGKSAFMSAIELLLRNLHIRGDRPLSFDEMPAFASFDSVVRRHWDRKSARPQAFTLNYTWGLKNEDLAFEFEFRKRPGDLATYVAREEFRAGSSPALTLTVHDATAQDSSYEVSGDDRVDQPVAPYFRGPVPLFLRQGAEDLMRFSELFVPLEVVHPDRPVPRSFYVLDDPALSSRDRDLVSFLIEIWKSTKPDAAVIRKRIVQNLTTLRLVTHFEVKSVQSSPGPRIVKIEVATSGPRNAVTIADVGFGVSQALPLIVADARLTRGFLIGYQPEVHLHPLAQSRLADVFCESVERGNQLFIETHSIDLVTRLQERVAAGKIAAGDVRVFCLANRKGVTEITRVDIGDGGNPSIRWPPGFVDSSLAVAKELAASRVKDVTGSRRAE